MENSIPRICWSCWFYWLAASCQQVATGLLVPSGGNRLAGTGLSQAVDNRAVATCWNNPLQTCLILTRDNRSDRTTCSKSDEINRLFQLVPTDLSRPVIAIGNIKSQKRDYSIYSVIKCKRRCFILKKWFPFPKSKFQFTDVCYRYISLISFLVAIGRNITNISIT
jgi:hypothetical protein